MADYYKLGDKVITAVRRGLKISPPMLKREWIDLATEDGSELAADKYENRMIELPIIASAATTDALIIEVNAIIAEAIKDTNVLEFKPDGATDSIYFDTFKADVVIPYDWAKMPAKVIDIVLRIPAQPLGDGDEIATKINRLIDGALKQDDDNDGTANSWTQTESNVTATESIDSDAQKIDVTAASAAGHDTITQRITLADEDDLAIGDTISAMCEYKCEAVTGNANYDIYVDFVGGAQTDYLVENRTAAQASFTAAAQANLTIPAATTAIDFIFRVQATAGTATGALWVKEALIIKHTAVPSSWYESRFTVPQEINFFSILGDVKAKTKFYIKNLSGATSKIPRLGLRSATFQGDNHATTPLIIDAINFDAPAPTTDNTCRHHSKGFSTAEAAWSTDCYVNFSLTQNWKGRYRVYARAYDTHGVVNINKLRVESLDQTPGVYAAAFQTWELMNLGELSLEYDQPSDIDYATGSPRIFISSLGTGSSGGFYVDYLLLIPVEEGMGIYSNTMLDDYMKIVDGYQNKNFLVNDSGDLSSGETGNYVGSFPGFIPGDNRLVVGAEEVVTNVFEVYAKYKPQYLLFR